MPHSIDGVGSIFRGGETRNMSDLDNRPPSVVGIPDSLLLIAILPQPEGEAVDGVNGRAVVSLRRSLMQIVT